MFLPQKDISRKCFGSAEADSLRTHSFEDWVSQDRILRLTDNNIELAKKLKEDREQHDKEAAIKAAAASKKKAAAASKLASNNDEVKNSSLPVVRGGKKRAREAEVEEVGDESGRPAKKLKADKNHLRKLAPAKATKASKDLSSSENDEEKNSSVSRGKKRARELEIEEVRQMVDAQPAYTPESSPGLPGYPKVRRRNNTKSGRSPLRIFGAAIEAAVEPPAKRQRKSPPSSSAPKRPSPVVALLDSPLDRGSTPPSPRGRKTKRHPIYGNAIIGSKHRSKNDPWGIHVERTDYPCGQLDAVLHRRPEYPERAFNPWAAKHKKIQADPRAGSGKRLFYEEQHEAGVLMVAGIPLEEKDTFAPAPTEPNPPGRKARGRKGAGSRKR